MIDLLRSNTPRSIAAFTVLFLLLFIPHYFFKEIALIHFVSYTFLAFVSAYSINHIIHKYQLLLERSYVPALVFALILPKDFSDTTILLILALSLSLWLLAQVYNFLDNKLEDKRLFDTGFIGGVAFLFYPFVLPIVLLPVFGMLYFSRLKIRLIILLLTAFFLPSLLLAQINYLINKELLVSNWPGLYFEFVQFGDKQFQYSLLGLVVCLLFGAMAAIKSLSKSKVSIRSGLRILFLFVFIALGMLLFDSNGAQSFLIFIPIPFSWYISNYLLNIKRVLLANFIFLVLLVFFLLRDYLYLFQP